MNTVRNEGTAHLSMRRACMTRGRTDSLSVTAFCDQPHRGFAHPRVAVGTGTVEALAPRERSDIAVFVHGFVGDEAQPFAQRRARVGIGTMIEEQASELGVSLAAAAIALRHDAAVQRCMAAKAVGVDFRLERSHRRHASISQRAISISSKSTQMCSSVVPARGVPCSAREWSAWHPNSGG